MIKPSLGFSNDIDEMIVREAKLAKCKEWEKHVVLIFDKMHIKEYLIFNKYTGKLKGFININDHLLQLESKQSEYCLPNLANSVIFSTLHFPYAQFPCKNPTGDQIYPLVCREAVECRVA